jgi:hypothetical protein
LQVSSFAQAFASQPSTDEGFITFNRSLQWRSVPKQYLLNNSSLMWD